MYEIDHIDMIDPLIVLTFDLEKKVTIEEWAIAFNFVNNLDDPNFSITEEMYELVPKAEENEKLTVAPLKEVVKQNNEYMFSHFIDKEKDICICEIFKPFTDLPYTTVIENFSVIDFEPLFTSLFICSSWGVSPKDVMFLKHLWNHLDMKGEFDLENRLKKVVEDCENGAPEPRVYRETLEQVKQKDFLK
jgi:NTP pyrophosphatase (non-canonical NTP hydrolase)